MSQNTPQSQTATSSASPRSEQVFLITKRLEELELTQASARVAIFKFMPGLFCPRIKDEPARIEPLLLMPATMRVRIDAFSSEPENPEGVSINGTIIEIPQYYRQVNNHRFDRLKCATPQRKIRISYNFISQCGGFALGPHDPLINSLSDLTHIYVKGASFYTVVSTARETPVTHMLSDFADPLLEQMQLGEVPILGRG